MKKICLFTLILFTLIGGLQLNVTHDEYKFTTGCRSLFAANIMPAVTWHFTTVNDDNPPYAQNFNPANNATSVSINTNISFDVCDNETGIDALSIRVVINGAEVAYTLNPISNGYTVNISGLTFGYNQVVNIDIYASDLAQ